MATIIPPFPSSAMQGNLTLVDWFVKLRSFVNRTITGLQVAEGVNAKQGVATLVAGASVVANTSVTANSRIFLTSQQDGGTVGFVRVSARVVGTSFTITSSSAIDTSIIAYEDL